MTSRSEEAVVLEIAITLPMVLVFHSIANDILAEFGFQSGEAFFFASLWRKLLRRSACSPCLTPLVSVFPFCSVLHRSMCYDNCHYPLLKIMLSISTSIPVSVIQLFP
jgi:hypothetical protein